MKYVRTKDGRVFMPNKIAHEPIGINGEWKAVACWYHGEPFDMEKEIVKVSENLEDLCDEFVLHYGDTIQTSIPIPWATYERRDDNWQKHKEKLISELKNTERKAIVYGAIWTNKGLVYIAKMNDNGELKLL